MKAALKRLRGDLGTIGLASLALIGATALFYSAAVQPLQERAEQLRHELDRRPRIGMEGMKLVGVREHSTRITEFYEYFDRPERMDEWLAKLHGAALASGVELRTGEYRLAESRERLARYEISLPVKGTYGQIRAFLDAALAEVPVASLDSATFRRKSVNENRVEAELLFTLHLLRK